MMDARRGQVYTGLYRFQGSEMLTVSAQKAVSAESIIDEINQIGGPVIYLGDGVPVFRGLIEERTAGEYSFAPPHVSRQRAGAVGALGIQYWKQGRIQTADEHVPDYLRLSQAERELLEKQRAAEGKA